MNQLHLRVSHIPAFLASKDVEKMITGSALFNAILKTFPQFLFTFKFKKQEMQGELLFEYFNLIIRLQDPNNKKNKTNFQYMNMRLVSDMALKYPSMLHNSNTEGNSITFKATFIKDDVEYRASFYNELYKTLLTEYDKLAWS